mmetsp:Transcript_90665/g.230712  ORF Transcript_90665/g.230712 Transcript_90665/m.230712 type:complete len:92 (-) Transcript_90665:545-820(-)
MPRCGRGGSASGEKANSSRLLAAAARCAFDGLVGPPPGRPPMPIVTPMAATPFVSGRDAVERARPQEAGGGPRSFAFGEVEGEITELSMDI